MIAGGRATELFLFIISNKVDASAINYANSCNSYHAEILNGLEFKNF
jgi:hypothetical protein